MENDRSKLLTDLAISSSHLIVNDEDWGMRNEDWGILLLGRHVK